MTLHFPVPRLARQIEEEWADELAAHLGQPRDDFMGETAREFEYPPGRVSIELMDGSRVEFKYCVYLVSEARRAIAVFTEHCGNHVFPYHEAKVFRDERLVWQQEAQ